ncbi:MAG TPA: bacteriohopanetetrol glucosamine biosynthesis glycosyltransferase HpnI [Steroidobacteraceae bacterium]|nr:bacteriohopanetetrol glucosamine biosynthesis glycosyltransferase HpnI [Steroidobacteraceae bacterium]
MHEVSVIVGVSLTAGAALYAVLTMAVTVLRRRTRPDLPGAAAGAPGVSVLKALCGSEPALYAQLRSFCRQDYPTFQLIFGVRDANDPALPIVRRLQGEFPTLDITVVVDSTLHGCNNKVSNLINMLPHVRYAWLVMADSDIRVTPDYLARVTAPLSNARVGLVTCAYFGAPLGAGADAAAAGADTGVGAHLASLLGAQFINEWFTPAALLAAAFGARNFVSGATIAMRAEVLTAIGGLPRLVNVLADDYRLGELVRRHGYGVHLAQLTVETCSSEVGMASLCRHELRWLRTIQSSQPLGYACCFPSFSLALAVLGVLLSHAATPALWLFGITALARIVLHYFVTSGAAWQRTWQLALLPLREALLLVLWIWSFRRREILWREQRYGIGEDGTLHRVG